MRIAYHKDRAHSPIIKAFVKTAGEMKANFAKASPERRNAASSRER